MENKIKKSVDNIRIKTDMQERILVNCINNDAHRKKIKDISPYKKAILAACVCILVISISISGFAVYTEAREYKEAVSFFKEYDLSTIGLTRSEVKGVYRDITAGRFTYYKTVEVIEKSVGGHEIFQAEPTPEDLENLWNYRNNNVSFPQYVDEDGVTYKHSYKEKYDSQLGFEIVDKAIFTKFIDGKEIWRVDLDNIFIEDYTKIGDSVIVFGTTVGWSSAQTRYGRIAMINDNGKILWDKTTSNGFHDEYITNVLSRNDKIIAFSRGDLNYLCFTELDMKGNVEKFTKNEVGNYGIWAAVLLADGYIVQLHNYQTGDLLIKVNMDGYLSDSFTYTSEDNEYYITGMLEFNGSVYLSAYSVPKYDGKTNGRYDIAAILDDIFENDKLDISNEELTKRVREHFTAVLLVCDNESGIPHEFYTVKGSLGAQLSLSEEGKLLWNVESITDTFFSPATSSFSIGGASYIYRYTFDGNGKIISQEKTGEVVSFRR